MAPDPAITVRTATTITERLSPTKRSGVGRPTAAQSIELGDRILDAAAALFLQHGYAATSIEAIARAAGVAKRTLYARFPDKGAIFPAVVHRLIQDWLVGFDGPIVAAVTLEDALRAAAGRMLDVALSPAALALHRLIVAESAHFPKLATALKTGGAADGVIRIAQVLQAHGVAEEPARLRFLARQFQTLVLGGPQAWAVGLGEPLSLEARAAWCRDSVRLFLYGAQA